MAMKLNTGKVAFPIEFDNGEKDCIYFNPNDPDFFIRLSQFEERIGNRTKDFEDIELQENGEPKDQTLLERMEKINKSICEELDFAFGGDISNVVFKYCSPFAIINGEYFLIQFVKAIRPEIEKHNKKATEEVKKKMSKHLNKYIK